MHSPVNIIAFNELTRDRIAEAEVARLARQGKPAAQRKSSPKQQAWKLLVRRARTA
jgi:hypothetical protein